MLTSDSPSTFGPCLRRLRLQAGLTQETLASRAGISKRAVQHLERGLGQPLRETARRLVATFALTGDLLREFQAAGEPTPRRRRMPSPSVDRGPADWGRARRGADYGPSGDGGDGSEKHHRPEGSVAERKLVTVVVAEIVEPAALFESLGLVDAVNLLDGALTSMRAAIHPFHGAVTSIDHGGMTVLFSAAANEQRNAVLGCGAALAMLQAVSRLEDCDAAGQQVAPVVRVGVASGEIAVRSINAALSADYMVAGRPIHSASRLARMAEPASAWIEQATATLLDGQIPIRPLGMVEASGSGRSTSTFELLLAWNDPDPSPDLRSDSRYLTGAGSPKF